MVLRPYKGHPAHTVGHHNDTEAATAEWVSVSKKRREREGRCSRTGRWCRRGDVSLFQLVDFSGFPATVQKSQFSVSTKH